MKKLLIALLVCAVSVSAHADFPEPNKTVKIITPLPAGSSPDVQARNLADYLSKKWKVPVIVENKPGGQGLIALNYYQQQPADGYSVYFAGRENIIQVPILYNREELSANLKLVTPFSVGYLALFSSPDTKNLADLKEKIKNKPIFSSWGVGSTGHLLGLELSHYVQPQDLLHVPYKEYGPWLTDVSTGTTTFAFGSVGSTKSFEQSGKLKYIAVTSATRLEEYPDVPTTKELIGKTFDNNAVWLAVFVDKNVPESRRKILETGIKEALQTAEMKKSFSVSSVVAIPTDNKDFSNQIDLDRSSFRNAVKKYKIEIQ